MMSASHLSAALLACWLIPLSVPAPGQAQAPSPITSSGLNTSVAKSGTAYDITGGTRPGNGPNLFHSFGEFGVPANALANFVNDSGLATSNILSRVTGGNPSNIFGTLRTTGFGAANLFLMNPAGIVFGPTASLNVGGSVSFTTADYLRLTDGAQFNALPGPVDASVSTAPVAAFGFLGSNPGAIIVQGGRLAVSEGQGLSLVGGTIEVRSNTLENGSSQAARLSAPGGHLHLASVASPGEVPIGGTLAGESALNSFASMGAMELAPGSVISASGPTAGRIAIRSGQFSMEGATLEANTTSIAPGLSPSAAATGGIAVHAEDIDLSHGSSVIASTSGGPAGHIRFEASSFRSNVAPNGAPLTGAAPVTIASTSSGPGGAGTITIGGKTGEPADAVLLSNTRIVTGVGHVADPMVAPGNIEITAHQVELANGTLLQSDTTGGADAGAITLNVDSLNTQAGPNGRVSVSSIVIAAVNASEDRPAISRFKAFQASPLRVLDFTDTSPPLILSPIEPLPIISQESLTSTAQIFIRTPPAMPRAES